VNSLKNTVGNVKAFQLLEAKLRSALKQAAYLPRTVALIWSATRVWTTIWLCLLLVQAILPVAVVYLTRPLVDAIVAAASARGEPALVRHALLLAAGMASVVVLSEIVQSLSAWVRTAQSELLQDHIRDLIHQKSVEADLGFYDSADYHDHLHRARNDGYYRSVALLECLGGVAQNGITLVAMAGVLFSFGAWLPLALVASTVPALYVVIRHNLRQHRWRMRHTEEERRAWYYGWVLTEATTAAEVRFFGLGDHFSGAYRVLRQRLRGESIELAKGQSLAELGAGMIALLPAAGAMAWVFWRAALGMITLGEMAAFYQAFQHGLRLARTLFGNFGQLYANTLFLGNLFAFLALEPQVKDPPAPRVAPLRVKDGIRFVDVTFRYPNSGRAVLDHFNLTIPSGRMVAIVGPNGGGKSTLVKLLCRFYDPVAGRIEIDGIDLRDLQLDKLRRLCSVLFQQPVRYNATVSENISFGDPASGPDDVTIRAAVEAAGATEIVRRLPHGYASLLGKSFSDGSELSVGEWQRIALARAFLRKAPILVLDEPTSAMDPWAEADWLERLRSLSAGRTAILITHRLTTAMRADVICVVAKGSVVESGSHEALLARGGLYSRSWAAQIESQPV
jgi:ATP-binding cassette subfamily B protein